MFSWINTAYNWVIGGISDLWNKVISIFQAVISWVQSWFDWFVNGIQDLWNGLANTFLTVERWALGELSAIANYIVQSIQGVISWAGRLLDQLGSDISNLGSWLSGWISRVANDLATGIRDITSWVQRDIWDPLYNWVRQALTWIARQGAWVFYMITHPDRLAQLLGRWILSVWVTLGRDLAKPAARWIVHTMLSAGPDIAGIIEDAIAAIL